VCGTIYVVLLYVQVPEVIKSRLPAFLVPAQS
jgi:hypothetical protein